MKKRSTTLLLSAVAMTALLGACGDDKKSSGGSSDAAYCTMIKAYKTKSDEMGSFMDSGDAKSLKTAFTTMQSMIHDLDKKAPSKLAADVHTMTGAVDKIVAIFAKYDWDVQKLAAAPDAAELSTTMNTPEVSSASERLDAYSTDVCKIAPDTTSS